MSWTDIPTEVMASSTIYNQDSVRICSLAVNMNNTDEKLLLYCRCLETLTLILAARAGNKLPNVYVFTEDQSEELKI